MAGHKELDKLHDTARMMLLDYRNELEARAKLGKIPSELKKVREQLQNLDLDFYSYGDIVDDALSQGKDASGLQKVLRNHQTRTMNLWQVLADDTIHHIVQKRTGGDNLANARGEVVREVVDRLRDKYGIGFGNDPSNMVPLSDGAHKGSQRPRGLELKSGVVLDDKSRAAHAGGNVAKYAKNLTKDQIETADSLFNELDWRIEEQLADAKRGLLTDTPRQNKINELAGAKAYGATSEAEFIPAKKAARGLSPDIVTPTYRLINVGGTLRLAGLGAGMGLVSSEEGLTKALEGDYVGAVQAAGKEMIIGEGIGQVVQKVAPQAAKIMPTITSGVAKIMPALMKASGAATAIQAGATIGLWMEKNVDINTAGSGRGSGSAAFSNGVK